MTTGQHREMIFEIKRVGHLLRVAAIDVATNVEVVVSVPASTPGPLAQNHARQRLEYVLKQRGFMQS